MDMAKPKIRFKGYTDEWEQRKFSDCYKMSSGYAFKMSDYCDEGVGLINGESIQHGIINDDNLNHLPESFVQHYPDFLLKENDIVVGLNRPITNGNLKIARIPSKYNDSLLYQRAGKIVYKTDCDKDFTYVFLSQEILKHTLVEAVGSDQPFISTSKLDGWKMMMPSDIEEQVKIGEYFQKLDYLITLHQRKCEQAKKLKKYMLQKMFPQNGQKVPEIRFKGFTDDWEQRKLGEFAEKTFGGGTPKTSNESFWKGNIPWIQSSDLIEGSLFDVEPRKYISQEAVDKSATKLVPENSVAIVTRVGVGKLAFMPFSYATSQDFLSLSVLKTEPQFTVYALYKKLQLELNTVQGTSIKGVTKDELLTKEIMIPCYEEQEKIGSYLHSLDHLITLHQRKAICTKNVRNNHILSIFYRKGRCLWGK